MLTGCGASSCKRAFEQQASIGVLRRWNTRVWAYAPGGERLRYFMASPTILTSIGRDVLIGAVINNVLRRRKSPSSRRG